MSGRRSRALSEVLDGVDPFNAKTDEQGGKNAKRIAGDEGLCRGACTHGSHRASGDFPDMGPARSVLIARSLPRACFLRCGFHEASRSGSVVWHTTPVIPYSDVSKPRWARAPDRVIL